MHLRTRTALIGISLGTASFVGLAPILHAQSSNLQKLNHVIVIYQENWSFDSLYGHFPGANGIDNAGAAAKQVDKNGEPYATLPQPLNTSFSPAVPDPRFPADLPKTSDGWALAQDPPRIEAHINHLSDHDFVFSGDSAVVMIQTLKDLAPQYAIDPGSQTSRFNLFRNLVFSQLTDMRLYGVLQVGGPDAVKATIDEQVDLSALRTA